MFPFFAQDSLWASEHIGGVFDQDPERVCILQNFSFIVSVLKHSYGGDASTVPTVE